MNNFLFNTYLVQHKAGHSLGWLTGQYRHDQHGMELKYLFFCFSSVTENNTPHDKVTLPLLLHK